MIPKLEYRNQLINIPKQIYTNSSYSRTQKYILKQLANGKLQIQILYPESFDLVKYSIFFTMLHSRSRTTTTIIMNESIEHPPFDEWSFQLLEIYNKFIEINIYKISMKFKNYESINLRYLYYQNFMDVIYTYFVDILGKNDPLVKLIRHPFIKQL